MKWFLIFIGSGIGGCLRFGIAEIVALLPKFSYPLATFFANLLACLIMGIVLGMWQKQMILDEKWKLFFTVGICGGFSTFSTFSNETLQLIQKGAYTLAAFYIIMSLVACIGAIGLGGKL